MNLTRTCSSNLLALLIVVAALTAGCAAPRAAPDSLFDRLGGLPVLVSVVDDTIDRMVADPRTRRSFDGIKLAPLKESIVEQLCSVSGGPCRYQGETMANAHRDSRITDAEFDLMVAALRDALDQRVGTAEKNQLLRLLAPMKRDVVSG